MTTIVKLQNPIEAHGKPYTELEFREPTGASLIDCGFPFEPGTGKIDTKVIANYIERLANIPISSVRALSIIDFIAASGAVIDFFKDTNLAKP